MLIFGGVFIACLIFSLCRKKQESHIPVISYADLQIFAAGKNAFISEFLFTAEALEIVAKSLPVLVGLYLFIHRELIYVISKEKAKKISIRDWQDQLQKQLSKDESRQFNDLFKELLCELFLLPRSKDTFFSFFPLAHHKSFEQFIFLAGEPKYRKLLLNEKSLAIQLLSTDDEGGDCLFRFIEYMVSPWCLILIKAIVYCIASIC